MESIYLLGGVQAIFLDLLLVFKKRKSAADKWLMIWLLLMAGHILFAYAEAIHLVLPDFLKVLNTCFPLLQGPLIFLYAQCLLDESKSAKLQIWPHLIPFILFSLFQKLMPESVWLVSLIIAIILSGSLYFSLLLIQLKKAKEKRSVLKLNKWLKDLVLSLMIIWACFILLILGASITDSGLAVSNQIIIALVSSLIFVWAFKGLNQGLIFVSLWSAENPAPVKQVKYAQSGLTDSRMDEIAKQIHEYMEKNQSYTQSSFSLNKMAADLDLSPYHLSQTLNTKMATKFYDFLNTYRIEKAKSLMEDPAYAHYSLLGIGLECGFQSKSTFNRAFKKNEGLSPSQYRNSLKE